MLQTEPRRFNTSGRGTIGHLFDGEADDTSADLHGLRLVNFELYRLFSKNERAKLRQVILQVVILGALNIVLEDRMTAADGDITDSQVTLMTSAQLELRMLAIWHDHMYHPA